MISCRSYIKDEKAEHGILFIFSRNLSGKIYIEMEGIRIEKECLPNPYQTAYHPFWRYKIGPVAFLAIDLGHYQVRSAGLSHMDVDNNYPTGLGSFIMKPAELFYVNSKMGLYGWEW